MTNREQHSNYNRSEKGRARYRRYRQTAKGQRNDRRWGVVHNVARREALIQRNEEALA